MEATTAPSSDMRAPQQAGAPAKQTGGDKAAFARILNAMNESAEGGLIRAFREDKEAQQGGKEGALDSEQGAPATPHAAAAAADGAVAAAASQQPPAAADAAGSLISFKPTDPILLDAYRMLALSPTAPETMHRPQWSSYDYHVLEKLYTGYASKVYKAVCKRSNQVVVLKSYQLSAICELYQHQIFREVALHASLRHEHVVQLSGAFQEGDFVVLVQEYAAGGNLFDLLQKYGGRLNEHVTVQMVLEPFLRVLQYLHTRGIIHRDIKPENILFNADMTLKLADFGLAIDLRRERAVTRAGTLDYMAPEVLNCPYKNKPEENKEKAHLHYGGTVDSWAVGVLAYELLVGCPPFYDSTRDRVEQRIRTQSPVFPRTMSEAARSFITSALTKDAAKRPSVLQLLNHPWINTFRSRRSMRNMATLPSSDDLGLATLAAAAGAPGTAAAAAGVPVIAANATAAASIAAAVSAAAGPKAGGEPASPAAAAAAAAAIAPAPSVAMPATPNTESSAAPTNNFFADAPASLQQQAKPAAMTFGSSSSSSSSAAKPPRGLATMTPPAQALKPSRLAAPAGAGEPLNFCPMASAKSSPLMVADAREVWLGCQAGSSLAAAAAAAAAAAEHAAAAAETAAAAAAAAKAAAVAEAEGSEALRKQKKWLGISKLWKDSK